MPDLSNARRGPLEHFVSDARSVQIRALLPASRFVFRCRREALGLAKRAFGLQVSSEPCRAATTGIRSALWQGPDEWLLLAPEGQQVLIKDAFATAFGSTPYSLVDVSHRHGGFEIVGSNAAFLLNSGCPLDLHCTAFPVGTCTRTLVDKAEIVLWRKSENTFHIETWRSFCCYIWRELHAAAQYSDVQPTELIGSHQHGP